MPYFDCLRCNCDLLVSGQQSEFLHLDNIKTYGLSKALINDDLKSVEVSRFAVRLSLVC